MKRKEDDMLVYVPQDYVALVYERGELRGVVEAGVGLVSSKAQVQYVYLEPKEQTAEEAQAAATLQ
jgi:hypothetical protein